MARDGYRIFDTDAHVGPYIDVLDPYLTADDRHAAYRLGAIQGTAETATSPTTRASANISGQLYNGNRGGGARGLHGGLHRREA